MKTPEAQIREKLYANVALQFERAIMVVVESRKPRPAKLETLRELVKLAYQSGVDRGYDMAYNVYSGDEPEDD